ncbi:hypothetical protein [Niabella drilacis]|uniref:PEGA domain-containing protein n=1 Tax=Niabella drilacis (strain DSM 25811 / CCM 8410 / CCUG 62505 / LMG 26954 / E90) TaxID=1285928 RepID=A0A1G6U727_NIADE|nr:hypothetical protein [Niabella drilacis]SDD37190.1 hypothetical protein SAMN04487894_108171 [Niabella drilacis]
MKQITTLSFLLIVCSLLSFTVEAKSKMIRLTTDEGAIVFLNGKQVSQPVKIVVTPDQDMYVRIEKVGFITQKRTYSYRDVESKKEYIRLEPDDAFENSFVTNIANQDIDIRASKPEAESWITLSRIITGYFDVIAITDKTTGYLCTAWSVKSFKAATIRTRLIIKTSSSDPLVYKAKLVSEYADAGTSANADEAFKKWDRVLRTFENAIPELQSRLGK